MIINGASVGCWLSSMYIGQENHYCSQEILIIISLEKMNGLLATLYVFMNFNVLTLLCAPASWVSSWDVS